jgi:hypothetical protein
MHEEYSSGATYAEQRYATQRMSVHRFIPSMASARQARAAIRRLSRRSRPSPMPSLPASHAGMPRPSGRATYWLVSFDRMRLVERSRHRSPFNFRAHLLCGLIAASQLHLS